MLLRPFDAMRILSAGLLALCLISLVQAQDYDQEAHIKCPITRELLLELDWPGVRRSVIPAYPAFAAAKRISGQVRVDIDISPKGTVTAAHIINGDKLLGAAAQEAALRWTFQPTENGAHAVSLTFIFRDLDYVVPKEKPECGPSPYTIQILWRASPDIIGHDIATRWTGTWQVRSSFVISFPGWVLLAAADQLDQYALLPG